MRSLYSLITLSFSAILSSALPAPQQEPMTGVVPFTFRNATLEDLDDVTTVHLDAFRTGPTWKYIRQFADIYPNYTWSCQREMFRKFYLNASTTGSSVFKVISVPDQSSKRRERVVSLSVWNLSLLNQAPDESLSSTSWAWLKPGASPNPTYSSAPFAFNGDSDFDCAAHLDVNMTRAEHLLKVMLEAEDKYLTKPYGPQFRLDLLATHPEWDGNGFAARHLRWGKETLGELNRRLESPEPRRPLTLIGTPAGYPLYISEGFKGLKNITIERLDGEVPLWYEALKYEQEEG